MDYGANTVLTVCMFQGGGTGRLHRKPQHHVPDQKHQTTRQLQHERPEITGQIYTSGNTHDKHAALQQRDIPDNVSK